MTAQPPPGALTGLDRHTLRHPDGRRLYVYGDLRGSLPDTGPAPVPVDGVALHQRRDLLTGDWVAVSPARNTRPQTGADVPAAPRAGGCPLCPGGPEVPFGFDAAVFENRFPSFVTDPPPAPALDHTAASRGRCEVVLYTEQHEGSLATLSPRQVATVVAVWRDRSQDLWDDPANRFVLIFENRGEAVGATLSHPHGQIYAFDRTPPITRRRLTALEDHRRLADQCLSCEVVRRDDAAEGRRVLVNDTFTVCVPFAARWPYEVHVRARRHGLRRLGDLEPKEQLDLARALQTVVLHYDALFGFDLPYMMVAQEAPADDGGEPASDWHLSFEFLPPHRGPAKLKVRASVETSTGVFINDTLPETSATELRDASVDAPPWADVSVPAVRRV